MERTKPEMPAKGAPWPNIDPVGIEASEARGQAGMLGAGKVSMPVEEVTPGAGDKLREWGVVLGEPYEKDPIFRPADLPEGWSIVASPGGTAFWTNLIDEAGTVRAAMFYKAAFYDRHAHIIIPQDALEL